MKNIFRKAFSVLIGLLLLMPISACKNSPSNETSASLTGSLISTEETTFLTTSTSAESEAVSVTSQATTTKASTPASTTKSGQSSSKMALGNLIDEEDDAQRFDISHLNLKATIESEQSINEVMRTIIPSFNPAAYKIYKNASNANGDDFIVTYRLMLGEYETSKGYSMVFTNNQAITIREGGISLSIPSNTVVNNLPAITDQIMQAAYQQGREDVSTRNLNFVVEEQRGYPFCDLATNECFYRVTTVYYANSASSVKGAISTQYKIA
jgi:hypothetical protein